MKKNFILLSIILLTGCGSKSNEIMIPSNVKAIVQDVNELHKEVESIENPFKSLTAPLDEEQYNRDMSYILKHNVKTNGRKIVTSLQAQEDLTKLFSLLKTMYCGYPLYGEERFNTAEKLITDYIKQKEECEKQQLIDLLQEHLSFIQDAHFQIDFQNLHDRYKTYYAQNDLEFVKEDEYYYCKGMNTPLLSIQNDLELASYLKPRYQNDGSVSYRLFYQSDQDITAVNLQFLDGSTKRISMVEDQPTEKEIGDIDLPYVHPRKMPYPEIDQDEKNEADAFLRKADEFRKADISILDLRGNTGGNAILSYEWIQRYTGTRMNGKAYRFLRMPLENEAFKNLMDVNSDQSIKDLQKVSSFISMGEIGYISEPDRKIHKQENVLFVLQDGKTASAAEMLIDFLHNVENVVFIGTPTSGFIEGSAMMPVYLENSGIQVVFGNLCSVYPKPYATERKGIQPDVWVSSNDVISYLLSLLDM